MRSRNRDADRIRSSRDKARAKVELRAAEPIERNDGESASVDDDGDCARAPGQALQGELRSRAADEAHDDRAPACAHGERLRR